MNWKTALAIYVLFWVMSGFLVLPFGIRSHAEAGVAIVPGQADGAPANFRPGRIVMRTTIVATLVFSLFYANYVCGWVTLDMLDVTKF